MSIDPRTELTRLLDALEAHLTAVVNRSGEHDPTVDEAYVEIANAFEAYEDSLFEAYNEVTPLSVYGDEDEDDEDEDDNAPTTEHQEGDSDLDDL